MSSTKANFKDDELVPDEISLAFSHGGGSTVTRTSSIMTSGGDPDNEDIVELVRGQCLVIFKRAGRGREIVCAGKYEKCQLKEHKRWQREERKRGRPGWFRGVFTQKGRLVGGWLDSRMTADEAKTILEARKIANRRAAGLASASGGKSEERSNPSHNHTSPESTETWDDCAVPRKGACIALGKHLAAEPKEEPLSLTSITEGIVREQNRLQQGKDLGGIQVGSKVEFKQGRFVKTATVLEVYSDPAGNYYLLRDADGREIQTEERFIVSVEAFDASKTYVEEERIRGGEGSSEAMKMMETLQQTIHMMKQRDAEHKAELQKVYAAIGTTQAKTGGEPADGSLSQEVGTYWYAIAKGGKGPEDCGVYTFQEARHILAGASDPLWRRVRSKQEGWDFIADYQEQQLLTVAQRKDQQVGISEPKPSPGRPVEKWYAVAKGREPESVGVYNSWAKASVEVEGVSNACFKSFKTEQEAEQFLLDYQERKELTSLQAAVVGLKMPSTSPTTTEEAPFSNDGGPGNLSGMEGRFTGPDPSQRAEGKVFGLVYTDETTLRCGLVPHPRSLPPQVQMHLLGQALDVAPLPYSVATGATDGADTGAVLSRALATMAGTQTDMELGGEPMDLNWKSGNKISLTSIKTLSQLRERLSELRQGKRAVEQTLLGRISSVLQHAGYEATVANEWAVGSILYRIGCDSQTFYIQLHEHILAQAWEDETVCDFENAKLEIEHHAAELRRRRTMYASRIMMICAVYAYLRDQSADNFRSAKLQEKRQKIQMLAFKKQVSQVESTYQKMKELQAKIAEGGQNNGRRNDKNKPMCWKCHQAGIHTGGKDNCLWKNLSDEEAKAKAVEWVAAKQAQIGGQARG